PRGRDRPWEPRGGGRGRFGGRFAARDREEAERAELLRLPRAAPKTPSARIVEILFGHPEFWDELSASEHELLHALPAPYGPLVAWLERDVAEHGPRPWAILRLALADDPSLDEATRAAADGDAHPDARHVDFRRAVDQVLERLLNARSLELSRSISTPDDLRRYQLVFEHWKEVKERLSRLASQDDSEV
ncbi:MAG TPA: hypothetical protein VF453_23215, partial [Burkholderiaceae bacterium]